MHPNTQHSATQAPTITIHVDTFQPFLSRVGLDEVIRVRFAYDPALVSKLKALLTVYQVGTDHKVVGGWLPKFKAWFVEPDVWPVIRMELVYLGHRVLERKS